MISPVPLVPLGFDHPEHTRYRRLPHPFFSPQTLNTILPSLQAQAISIIDGIAAGGECEVMAGLATPYPSQVFLTLFGLPLEDRMRLIAWKDAVIGFSLDDPEKVDLTPAIELFAYLTEAIHEQRKVARAGPLGGKQGRWHPRQGPLPVLQLARVHVDIHKFQLAGQIDSYDLESEETMALPPLCPGDHTCLERGHARGPTIAPGSWHLEYGRGAVATTLPFAMVDTLLVSLEFESVRRSTVEFAKLARRGKR